MLIFVFYGSDEREIYGSDEREIYLELQGWLQFFKLLSKGLNAKS